MTPTRRKYLLFSSFMLVSLILDQWTKVWAREALRPPPGLPPDPKVILRGYFDLRYAENPGVAFSMLQDIPGGRVLLTLLALLALVMVVLYLRKTPLESSRLHVALGLVGGGAIGNLVDRVAYGKVTDFIVLKVVLAKDYFWFFTKGPHEWPAFNIADAALCVGVGLILLDMILESRRARAAA